MKKLSYLFALVILFSTLACKTNKNLKNPNTDITENNSGEDDPSSDEDYDPNTDESLLTLSVNERLMIDEINLIRTSPQGYIQKVKEYMKAVQKDPGVSYKARQNEVEAARELIFELSRMAPIEELQPHEGLYQLAKSHGAYVRQQGQMTHTGPNGSYPWDRIITATAIQDGNENLVGGGKTIRESILILLVDSDVEGRGHRLNILNPNWKYIACHQIGMVGGVDNSWLQLFGSELDPDEVITAPVNSNSESNRTSNPVNRNSSMASGEGNEKKPETYNKSDEAKKGKPFWKKNDKKNQSDEGGSTSVERPSNTNPNTAAGDKANYDFMKTEEMEMIKEINLMRKNPKGYIFYVRLYVEEFKKAGWDAMTTQDEVNSANELIGELERLGPLSILKPHRDLHQVAVEHGEHMRRIGQVTHSGSDGSQPYERIRKKTSLQDGNENLVGGGNNVRESVIMLLVDSGISNRGHRKALLNPSWKYASCYKIGKVGVMPNTWVQNFGF